MAKKKKANPPYEDIDMMDLDSEEKRKIALIKKATDKNGKTDWELFKKLVVEDAKSGK